MSAEIYNVSYDHIKDTFLDYYREKGHLIIDGSSIVPKGDPTLLVINSGMAPMKPFFTGEAIPPSTMLANSQLCVRTTDIDSIGDETHGTSFSMLGNWSFGAYGKEQAIDLAMGLVSEGYGLTSERLLATTYRSHESLVGIPDDGESYSAWQKYFPNSRIIPSPPEDNFWGPAGTSGPCGPCTELFYDRTPDIPGSEQDGLLIIEDQRHAEIWNAGVFMEYEKAEDGSIRSLGRLCVDGGAGLERFAMVLQNAASIHEIDKYLPAFEYIQNELNDIANARIVFDHFKTAKLMIESGFVPDRNGAGSVTRRLVRRAVGVLATNDIPIENIPLFYQTVSDVSENTPEQKFSEQQALEIFRSEISGFEKTLMRASKYLDKAAANGELSGKQVFDAQSSQGIPLDLIKSYCQTHNLPFPDDSYQAHMDEHKAISKASKK